MADDLTKLLHRLWHAGNEGRDRAEAVAQAKHELAEHLAAELKPEPWTDVTQDRLDVIKRRIKFLQGRIGDTAAVLEHDIRELAALEWAVDQIRAASRVTGLVAALDQPVNGDETGIEAS